MPARWWVTAVAIGGLVGWGSIAAVVWLVLR